MNGFLLDTQIVLWAANEPARLSAAVARVIREERHVFVSAASIWEIAIKTSIGKLTVAQNLIERLIGFGFMELAVTWAHGQRAAELPNLHRDPFDRLLAAQTLVENLVLATTDRALLRYPIRTIS